MVKEYSSSKITTRGSPKITTTLTAPGTVGAAVGRDVWSKILGETSVEKLIDKGSSFKD